MHPASINGSAADISCGPAGRSSEAGGVPDGCGLVLLHGPHHGASDGLFDQGAVPHPCTFAFAPSSHDFINLPSCLPQPAAHTVVLSHGCQRCSSMLTNLSRASCTPTPGSRQTSLQTDGPPSYQPQSLAQGRRFTGLMNLACWAEPALTAAVRLTQVADDQADNPLPVDVGRYEAKRSESRTPRSKGGTQPPSQIQVTTGDAPLGASPPHTAGISTMR